MLEKITSALQIINGTEDEWNRVETIIPDGLLCYAVDTGNVKKGNGKKKFVDLMVLFNIQALQAAATHSSRIPHMEDTDRGKFLVVAADGLGLRLSANPIQMYATSAELADALDTIRNTIAQNVTIDTTNSNLGTAAFQNVGINEGKIPLLGKYGKLDKAQLPPLVVPARKSCSNSVMNWLLIDKMYREGKSILYYRDSIAIVPEHLEERYMDPLAPIERHLTEDKYFKTIGDYMILSPRLFTKLNIYPMTIPVIQFYIDLEGSNAYDHNTTIKIASQFTDLPYTAMELTKAKAVELQDTEVNSPRDIALNQVQGKSIMVKWMGDPVDMLTEHKYPSFIIQLGKSVKVTGFIISTYEHITGIDISSII